MIMRSCLALALLTASTWGLADDQLQAAIDSDRPATESVRDAHRHPYETLSFFGITPAATVVELFPGGGWYTAILAPYLKDDGHYVAAHWNLEAENAPGYFAEVRGRFETRFADSERFGDFDIISFDPPTMPSLGTAASADLVLTFRNVHGWKRAGSFDDILAAAHEVLKPGGVFGVVSHRLPEAADDDPEARSGYVKQSWVIAKAEAHGFRLDAASEVNANPADTADHPNGVWTLPPSLSVPEGGDREHFRAIGESDRFTLRFVKE